MSSLRADRIRLALRDLGKDAHMVAQTLQRQGIRGVRRDSCECPVARYLRREFPAAVTVSVGSEAWLWDHPVKADHTAVTLPGAVNDFRFGFDCGAWPVLEEK